MAQEHDEALGMRIRTTGNLWINWFDIACEQEGLAKEAREVTMASREADRSFTKAVGNELRASMIAVSVSAHAIDAFYGRVAEITKLPEGVREKWRANRTSRRNRILETLKTGFDLGAPANHWAGEFRWLYELRDAAVHHTPITRDAVPHPSGLSNISQEAADYSVESAGRAADLALAVITTCIQSPRQSQAAVATWASNASHVPGILREIRAGTRKHY